MQQLNVRFTTYYTTKFYINAHGWQYFNRLQKEGWELALRRPNYNPAKSSPSTMPTYATAHSSYMHTRYSNHNLSITNYDVIGVKRRQ